MIEIKKPSGSNIGTIYKKSGFIYPFVSTNLNTNPILLISAPTNETICIVNWFFSFGDEYGPGIIDSQFYLINSSYLPLNALYTQSTLVSFFAGSGPVQISGNTYSGTQAIPTYGNCGSDIYLTQISDTTNGWQFLKWTIYYTLIPHKDIYP
jgi:hypothetical protein